MDPDKYVNDDSWQRDIGEVWHCYNVSEDYWMAVIFAPHGTRFDITIESVEELGKLVTNEPSSGPNECTLGYRVLVDKDDMTSTMAPPFSKRLLYERPSESKFSEAVDKFWHEAHNVAKYLAREDMWAAKHRDWNTHRCLLPMLEWHAHANHGWDYDTAHIGKRMRTWIDPEIWEALHRTFASFGVEESWNALFATIDLFKQLSSETAEKLNYQYPDDVSRNMINLIKSMRRQLVKHEP